MNLSQLFARFRAPAPAAPPVVKWQREPLPPDPDILSFGIPDEPIEPPDWLLSGPPLKPSEVQQQDITERLQTRRAQRVKFVPIEDQETIETDTPKRETLQLRSYHFETMPSWDVRRPKTAPLPDSTFFATVRRDIFHFQKQHQRMPRVIRLNSIRVSQHLVDEHSMTFLYTTETGKVECIPLVSSLDIHINDIELD